MQKLTSFLNVTMKRGRVLLSLLACLFGVAQATQAATIPNPASALTNQPLEAGCPELNAKRLFALGMIETGNNDYVIGSAGEVSRYQLSPAVWKSYRKTWDYQNPEISWQVARLHWTFLASYFHEKTGRAPTDFDMYVLWNTRYGYYAHKGFEKNRLSPVVKERAQRFVNLVNRKD